MRLSKFFHFSLIVTNFLLLASCNNGDNLADAFGNFESDEIIVSAQNTGELIKFKAEEGEKLSIGELVGVIDTVPVILQRNQLLAQKNTLDAKRDNIRAQADVQEEPL
jgi:HlyD family secretion protein